jgi:hypothetical protein
MKYLGHISGLSVEGGSAASIALPSLFEGRKKWM